MSLRRKREQAKEPSLARFADEQKRKPVKRVTAQGYTKRHHRGGKQQLRSFRLNQSETAVARFHRLSVAD
jgi:hypothetical protein